jgi:hypothetical protein
MILSHKGCNGILVFHITQETDWFESALSGNSQYVLMRNRLNDYLSFPAPMPLSAQRILNLDL